MVWGLFLLLGIIVAIHAFEYQHSVQEYIFTQPPKLESAVLREKTPAVVEIGVLPWRPGPSVGPWTVVTDDGTAMPAADWWAAPASSRPVIANGTDLAAEMELSTGLAEINDARPWWWLPALSDVSVDYLSPGKVQGLQWISAERHWIGCSAGAPVTVWLVHSRYRRYLPVGSGELVDPWSITAAVNPWIGRVQFIEVRVKPGWCLGIPSHWGFAVRPEIEAAAAAAAAEEGSAVWNAAQHSALSWCMSHMEYIPLHIESLNQSSED
jgi:hypothetical protein